MLSQEVLKDFSKFGKSIFLSFFIFIINFIVFFVGFLLPIELLIITSICILAEFLLILYAFVKISRINKKIVDENFNSFYTCLILSFIIGLIGSVIANSISYLLYPINLFLSLTISIPIVIIYSSLIYKTWANLENFFTKNKNAFPDHIGWNAADASGNLKHAMMLFIFSFLIIPIIIGIVLSIRGYYLLGSSLKKI